MRIMYAALAPLLLLGGCATAGMGPHAQGADAMPMAGCPMASPPSDTARRGAMMGQQEGQMPEQSGQMMQSMHHGDTANCPPRDAAASAPPAPAPGDPHQH
jgi:hypothetical protein